LGGQDDVAGHQLGGRHQLDVAVADDLDAWGGHGLERRHRLLGPVLLNKADDSVQDDDSQDHDRVLQVADDRRDRRGRDQDQDDGVGELLGQ
jgi:hypothetical protein